MKIKQYIICFLIFFWNTSYSQQTNVNTGQLIDSLKNKLEINDSIKVLKVDTIQNSVAFIDYNKYSKFHTQLLLTRGNNIDIDYYKECYIDQKNKSGNYIAPQIPENIVKKWIKLYKYEGEFHVYKDCDFQTVLEITDTTFNVYNMDGASPSLIIGFEKQGKRNVLLTYNNRQIIIESIDNQSIFRIKGIRGCDYYTPSDMINHFNIIVHHCTDLSEDIIDFEETICE